MVKRLDVTTFEANEFVLEGDTVGVVGGESGTVRAGDRCGDPDAPRLSLASDSWGKPRQNADSTDRDQVRAAVRVRRHGSGHPAPSSRGTAKSCVPGGTTTSAGARLVVAVWPVLRMQGKIERARSLFG